MSSIVDWSNTEVINWLSKLNLRKYSNIFTDNNITGNDLILLSKSELKSELQIENLHERLKLYREITKLILSQCKKI